MAETTTAEPGERARRFSAPLAASGALLAALAVVGLARGYERSRDVPPLPTPTASATAPAPASAPQVARLVEGQRLDLNRATAEELQLLPRIGPRLADRILEEREHGGPFRSLRDLTRVRGIGPRTVERLAPLAEVVPHETPAGEALAPPASVPE